MKLSLNKTTGSKPLAAANKCFWRKISWKEWSLSNFKCTFSFTNIKLKLEFGRSSFILWMDRHVKNIGPYI